MELQAYAEVLRRRWPAVLVLPVLVLALVGYLDQSRTPNFSAHARVSVSRISDETTESEYEFDDYYDNLSTEFIIDDLLEIVRGNVFASAVAERMTAQGVNVDLGTVAGALSTSREHRVLTIQATTKDHGLSVVIANVAATELRENFASYIGPSFGETPLTIRPVDVPTEASPDTNRVRLLYILALVVAGGFGLLLALLWEYFDESLYDAGEAAATTGLALLGSVPGDDR
jgi:capsular polysaccharide biosynthesis protein